MCGAFLAVELMRKFGVQRRLVSRDELLKIEPAFKAYGDKITGGTYTSTDESGDARVFTQELARRCAARGAQFLYGHDVLRLNKIGDAIDSVAVIARKTGAGGQKDFILKADAFVVACGSYSAPLLRTVGVDLPIYPGKGYSATFPLLRPEGAPMVSTIDDGKKIADSGEGYRDKDACLETISAVKASDEAIVLENVTSLMDTELLSMPGYFRKH